MSQSIVIIGNGIAGITCARYIRKQDSDVKITVVSSETKHFFSRTALMYVYMGHMTHDNIKPYEDWFWSKNRLDLLYKHVVRIDTDARQLILDDTTSLNYDKLVIATGSKSNFFGWPGQELKGVQGLYSYSDLESMERNTKDVGHAVVVGGGLIGIELAEMLLSRGIGVSLLVREPHFWGGVLSPNEANLIESHIRAHNIDLRLSTELEQIVGNEHGDVEAAVTKEGKTIKCGFVGIATGVSPNIDFFRDSKIKTDKGVLVNEYFETNIPDVFAIGDCAQFAEPIKGRKPIEQVWYTGRIQGQVLAQNLCNNKTAYDPGPWFNSAKFFDIEYQNYGLLQPQPAVNENVFYWQLANRNVAIRIHFEKGSKRFKGINTFGIRLRHELLDYWLRNNVTIEEVLMHLKDANFDPEFQTEYENDIIAAYNKQFGAGLVVKKRSWKRIIDTMKKLKYA